MPTTFEVLASRTAADSDLCHIEVRRTLTEYCPNHWFIVFRHKNGDYISASVVKRLDPVEWTQNSVLHPSDFIKFDITYKCPGIRDLAACIFIPEHLRDPHMSDFCCCSQWV